MKEEEELNRFMIVKAYNGDFELSHKDFKKEEKLRIFLNDISLFTEIEYLLEIINIYGWKLDDEFFIV